MPETTAGPGKLPDFIIVGTQKGGTSSLQHHLRRHPQIEMAPNFQGHTGHEPHFFNKHYDRGVDWYRSLFRDNGKLQGEKTPGYLSAHKSHPRLREVVPECRLIAILRDPVDRAESAFNHAVQVARQRGVRELGGWNAHLTFEQNLQDHLAGRRPGNYLRCGCYIDHLESLLSHFSRQQFLVLISEEYRREPAGTLNQVFRFLGAEPMAVPYSPFVHKRPKEATISEPCKAWLRQYYAPFNHRLFQFLGREIPDWR